jgi:hypothetical protein
MRGLEQTGKYRYRYGTKYHFELQWAAKVLRAAKIIARGDSVAI